MKSLNKIIILSSPRSGSSLLTKLIELSGYDVYKSVDSYLLPSSEFNRSGYLEDNLLTLLNDQIIRMVFGADYSFLHTPSMDEIKTKFKCKVIEQSNYSYDITDDTLFVPKNYNKHIKQYTGANHDIWAITRMIDNGKWEKCYSKNNVKTYSDIMLKIKEVSKTFNNNKTNLVLKDPRLVLTLPFFNFSDTTKFIYLTRKNTTCLDSMKKHYGINLFTQNYIPGTDICSNYFNYKIKYQTVDSYFNIYNNTIEHVLENKPHIKISYEDILENKVSLLEDFIGKKINTDLIIKS